jgi:predicted nucleotidyltransferase
MTGRDSCINLSQIRVIEKSQEATMNPAAISIPRAQINAFCRRHGIRKLSFFGSVLKANFTSEDWLDVLVEFRPGKRIGILRLRGIETELAEILGRPVNVYTPDFLRRCCRDRVLAEAEVQYETA